MKHELEGAFRACVAELAACTDGVSLRSWVSRWASVPPDAVPVPELTKTIENPFRNRGQPEAFSQELWYAIHQTLTDFEPPLDEAEMAYLCVLTMREAVVYPCGAMFQFDSANYVLPLLAMDRCVLSATALTPSANSSLAHFFECCSVGGLTAKLYHVFGGFDEAPYLAMHFSVQRMVLAIMSSADRRVLGDRSLAQAASIAAESFSRMEIGEVLRREEIEKTLLDAFRRRPAPN